MTSGQRAEATVADWLRSRGIQIVDRNWRTRYCEIDIVAKAGELVLFVEVKYRSRAKWGSGFEYVTPRKVARMARGARLWVSAHHWRGPYQLAAVAVTGESYKVEGLIRLG